MLPEGTSRASTDSGAGPSALRWRSHRTGGFPGVVCHRKSGTTQDEGARDESGDPGDGIDVTGLAADALERLGTEAGFASPPASEPPGRSAGRTIRTCTPPPGCSTSSRLASFP